MGEQNPGNGKPFDDEVTSTTQTPAAAGEDNLQGDGDFLNFSEGDVEPVDPNSAPTTANRVVDVENDNELPYNEPRDPRGRDELFTRGQKWATVVVAGGALVVAALLAATNDGEQRTTEDKRTTEDIVADLVEADGACPDTWAVSHLSEEDNKVIAEGLNSLGAAETKEQSRVAAQEAFDLIKHDPELLADSVNVVAEQGGIPTDFQPEDLYDGGCFNRAGEKAANTLQTLLATAEIIPDDPLPSDINTGVNEQGRMVRSSEPGLTGDLSGISIVLANGERIGWLDRCGNFTFGTPPALPVGPTDQDVPKAITTVPGQSPTTRLTVPGQSTTTRPGEAPTTTGPESPTTTGSTVTVPPPPKHDDGRLPQNPADGPAGQDKGTPDPVGAGQGPAEQTPNDQGYIPTEPTPSTQAPRTTTSPPPTSPPPTYGGSPPTTGQQVEAPPQPVTTIKPQPNDTTPPKPAV